MRLRFGPCVFDSRERTLVRNGRACELSPKAFALLEALIEARPEALSRDQLQQKLWPDTFVEPGNLHNLVSEVRNAVEDDDRTIIRTIHRFGYAFAAAAVSDEAVHFAVMIGDEEIPLREGANMIGRDPRAAIVVNAPEISRHHARLLVCGPEIDLEDLGSKNGTYIGNKRVRGTAPISPGDEIVIGKIRIRVISSGRLPTTATLS